MFIEMDKAKQGIALKGKAREIAISIAKSLLTTENGIKNVLVAQDKLFEKEKTYQMYEVYTKFESFKKTEAMSMLDYIPEFEQLNKKCTNLKIDTDALLTLKLLLYCKSYWTSKAIGFNSMPPNEVWNHEKCSDQDIY